MDRFQDFEVWIDAPASTDIGPWAVRAFSSAGPAYGRFDFDLGDPFRTQLAIATGADTSKDKLRLVGQQLYAALFNGGNRDAWMTSVGLTNSAGTGLGLLDPVLKLTQLMQDDGLRLALAPQRSQLSSELHELTVLAQELVTCRQQPLQRSLQPDPCPGTA